MLSLADSSLIAEQLGHTPRTAVSVAARCPFGHPSVVSCYPLWRDGQRWTPFPTLYWLTCPSLRRQVSHLERRGAIAAIQAEVASDEALRASLSKDHEDYIAQRWALLSPTDRSAVAEHGLLDAFKNRGIGGTSSRSAIKCLHAHLAHYLASDNAIGRLLVDRYGVCPCSEDSVKESVGIARLASASTE